MEINNLVYEIRVIPQLRFHRGHASLFAEENKGRFKKGDYIKTVAISTVKKMAKPLRVKINEVKLTKIPVINGR